MLLDLRSLEGEVPTPIVSVPSSAEYGSAFAYGVQEYGQVQFIVTVTRSEAVPLESQCSLAEQLALPLETLSIKAAGQGVPVEARQSLADGVVLPVESKTGIVDGQQIPVESGASAGALIRDEQDPVETGQQLSLTLLTPVESLKTVTLGQAQTTELLNDDAETEDPFIDEDFEYKAYYPSVLTGTGGDVPVDERRTLARSEALPLETLASQAAGVTVPVEDQTGVADGVQLPIDTSPTLLRAGVAIPLESLATTVPAVVLPVEATTGLSDGISLPLESSRGLAEQLPLPLESSGTLASGTVVPVEARQGLAEGVGVPVESTTGIPESASVPVEAGDVLAQGQTIPVEDRATLSDGQQIPIETIAQRTALNRDEAIPIDQTKAVARLVPVFSSEYGSAYAYGSQEYGQTTFPVPSGGASIPIDSQAAQNLVAHAETVPVEDLRQLTLSLTIPVEPLATRTIGQVRGGGLRLNDDAEDEDPFIDADFEYHAYYETDETGLGGDLPLSDTRAIAVGQSSPVAASSTIAHGEEIPYESSTPARTAVTMDASLPLESLAGVQHGEDVPIDTTGVSLIALALGAAIPIDVTTAAPAPFNFLMFLAGGAKWPPSWLVRAPLLARDQQRAILYFGGTSWSTWRDAAQPATVVPPKKPTLIRKPKRRPIPATVVSAHSTLLWVGGRSTESTSIDWSIRAKQDESDLLALLPLL